ncbi:hypothetical protein DS843_13675 [Roseomonas genomospecies 6]|uniref:Uncharacterized protein n=1 Tax=Roseomonas genomospecies 6 TaxID=214106 RepID=A0A9W7TXY1_9PROT|nr:hypothetical protein DS843_13675 [Roseomonas genomospecies 6]
MARGIIRNFHKVFQCNECEINQPRKKQGEKITFGEQSRGINRWSNAHLVEICSHVAFGQ